METIIKMGAVRTELKGSAEVVHEIRELLTVDHPGARHTPAFKMGRWDGRVRFASAPKFVSTRPEHQGVPYGTPSEARMITFPAGLTRRVLNRLAELGQDFSLHDSVPRLGDRGKPDNCLQGITLRDYQIEVVRHALQAGRLSIQCPTGSGKTEIGAAIVKMAGVLPTLWLVHRKELLHQTYERLKARLGEDADVGRIGAGHNEPGFVTVAMVQTLANLDKRDPFWNHWHMLIVDEVHHLSAETWYDIVAQCELAFFRFGLSGTIVTGNPVKDYKLEGATGPLHVAARTMELAEQGFLAKPLIHMIDLGQQHYPSYASVREEVCPSWRANPRQLSSLGGKLFATAYRRGITENAARNSMIMTKAAEHARDGEKILVLCTRLSHGKKLAMLAREYKVSGPLWWLHGSEDDDVRQHSLKKFKSYDGGAIMIASNIFDEGVDIPEIDVLILAGAGESYIKSIQRVGRALRPKKDKDYVLVYDFLDGRDPTDEKDYLARHTHSRIQDYKAQDFQVKREQS